MDWFHAFVDLLPEWIEYLEDIRYELGRYRSLEGQNCPFVKLNHSHAACSQSFQIKVTLRNRPYYEHFKGPGNVEGIATSYDWTIRTWNPGSGTRFFLLKKTFTLALGTFSRLFDGNGVLPPAVK